MTSRASGKVKQAGCIGEVSWVEESRGWLSSGTLGKARTPSMKDRTPGNIMRILYGHVKSELGQAIKEKFRLTINESRLYDLVKNEGEDGSDGQRRSDSCQGWEGIATL